jgi:hypothetical protein
MTAAGWKFVPPGGGHPRTRPDRVLADKAYGSRANRAYLRRRGIRCTILEKADQVRNRTNKGGAGGLAVRYEATLHIAAINEWLRSGFLTRPRSGRRPACPG